MGTAKRSSLSAAARPRWLSFEALVEFCMPRGLADLEEERRSRLVVRVALMTLAVCLLMEIKYFGEGTTAIAIVTFFSIVLQLTALVLHRVTGSYRIGGHGFCFSLWGTFFGIATLSGGIDSPNLVANAFLVVVSPMLLGRRDGLVWLGAGLVTPLAQLGLTHQGLVRQTLPLEDVQATRLAEFIATFTTVFLTAHFYQRGQDRMNVQLAREKRLVDVANQDLRVILDNCGQGFLSLDRSGRITGECSAVIGSWFQPPANGQSFESFLTPINSKAASWFGVSWDQIQEELIPLEVALDQMPKQLSVGEKTFRVSYRPVNLRDESFDKLVVILSDISGAMASERTRRRQGDVLEGCERILRDPEGFQSFLESARHAVDVVKSDTLLPNELLRCLHTLKGNAAVMGLSALAEQCHLLEDELALASELERSSVDAMEHELTLVEERLGPLLRKRALDEVSLWAAEYDAFLRDVVAGRSHAELAMAVRSWPLGRVESHFGRLAEHARQVATRLSKGPLQVLSIDNGLRSPADLAEFWNVLVHVVRNAVDHGIEPSQERLLLGKAQPRIELRAVMTAGSLVIEIVDDGRGIDWRRVRERACELGLKADTQQELLSALFADGLSTSREVSDISGRGVGLSSVVAVCSSLGIHIDVDSAPNAGTTFRFTVLERESGVAGPGESIGAWRMPAASRAQPSESA